jgi:hypothetical protein
MEKRKSYLIQIMGGWVGGGREIDMGVSILMLFFFAVSVIGTLKNSLTSHEFITSTKKKTEATREFFSNLTTRTKGSPTSSTCFLETDPVKWFGIR